MGRLRAWVVRMIIYIDGDLFESPAKVLVNTVNTRGVMGKGIALRFKRIYPDMFKRYRDHCEHNRLTIGKLFLYKTPHKWVLNFPTKEHWRNPSRAEYIEKGLQKFVSIYDEVGINSIAFPALGCGNGELDYESQVGPLMEAYLGRLSIPIFIHLGRRHSTPPEHRDAKRIEAWLRSEPSALPFDEVWRDILDIVCEKREFKTRVKQHSYLVQAGDAPPELSVISSGKTFRIISDDLVFFWQQLRDYGLTHSGIAPEHRYLSYLMPVFAELPYVHPVAVSETTKGLRTNPAAGLQVIPPARPTTSSTTGDLFENATNAAQA